MGKKTLTKSAELKSYETVVFTVPAEGKASVVAVDEVLFSAKGLTLPGRPEAESPP